MKTKRWTIAQKRYFKFRQMQNDRQNEKELKQQLKSEWKNKISRLHKTNRKQYGNNLIFNNIINEKIDYHHLTNSIVLSIPRDLHKLYNSSNKEAHRFMCNEIVKQIYIGGYE